MRNKPAVQIGSLSEEAKWWLKFISSRILGNTREGEVNVEQQSILFCALTGMRFDVGRLICGSLEYMKSRLICGKASKLSLSFPSLITLLCKDVPRPPGNCETAVKAAIDRTKISRADSNIPSTLIFHQTYWARKDESGWSEPPYDVQLEMPQLEYPGQGSGADQEQQQSSSQQTRGAAFEQTWPQWTEFQQSFQDFRLESRQQWAGFNDRFQGVEATQHLILANQAEMQAQLQEFFARYPPPPPQQ